MFGGRPRARTEGPVLLDTSVVRTSELYLGLRVEFVRYRQYLRFGREAEGDLAKAANRYPRRSDRLPITNNYQVLPVGTGSLWEAS